MSGQFYCQLRSAKSTSHHIRIATRHPHTQSIRFLVVRRSFSRTYPSECKGDWGVTNNHCDFSMILGGSPSILWQTTMDGWTDKQIETSS